MKKNSAVIMLGASVLIGLIGCSSNGRSRAEMAPYDVMASDEPGVQTGVWEPPIVDVVEVPPGLDPEGHYYRPSHEEIVEIRQGRWKVQDSEKTGR